MKTGKYFLGGAVKGLGGKAVKFFMKQPSVKKQIADKIIEINNVYAKASKPKYIPASKSFKNALEKIKFFNKFNLNIIRFNEKTST